MAVQVEKIKERETLNEGRGPSLRRAPPVFVDKGAYMQMAVRRRARDEKKKFPSLVSCSSLFLSHIPSLFRIFSLYLCVSMPLLLLQE